MSSTPRRNWTEPPPRQPRPPARRRRAPALPAHHVQPPPFIAAAARWASGIAGQPDRLRGIIAFALALCGFLLASLSVWADVTVHRGVGDGVSPLVVRQYTGRDLATNVDLTRFTPEQLSAVAAGLQANGFRYVRQSFSWAEIEPAPGNYVWDQYDAIVGALSERGIGVIAVLHRSPAWIRSPEGASAFDSPPADLAAFERFVGALASRYGDQVSFLQIWDLPNDPQHWGNANADPGAYVSMLALASNAARGANPNAVILLAELEPFPPQGSRDDVAFLRGVYDASGSAFFDIVAARVSGGTSTPYDRTTRANHENMSRVILLREVIAASNDPAKPIWATHFGWSAGSDGVGGFGEQAQAEYAIAGLQRARAEWPWMGPLFQWGLTPGPDLGGSTPAGLALLRDDGSPTSLFTELGAFFVRGGTNAAPTGLAPVNAQQFVWEGNWELQHLGRDTYRTTSEVDARFRIPVEGNGVVARARLARDAGNVDLTIDGAPRAVSLDSFQAADVDITLARNLASGTHEVAMRLTEPGELTIGGLVVQRTVPMQWPIQLLLLSGVAMLFFGLFDGLILVAERSGALQRRRSGELWPELPQLPDWRPARRA